MNDLISNRDYIVMFSKKVIFCSLNNKEIRENGFYLIELHSVFYRSYLDFAQQPEYRGILVCRINVKFKLVICKKDALLSSTIININQRDVIEISQ